MQNWKGDREERYEVNSVKAGLKIIVILFPVELSSNVTPVCLKHKCVTDWRFESTFPALLTYGSYFIHVNAHNISHNWQSAADWRIAFGLALWHKLVALASNWKCRPASGLTRLFQFWYSCDLCAIHGRLTNCMETSLHNFTPLQEVPTSWLPCFLIFLFCNATWF
jgi:hypothetical protein